MALMTLNGARVVEGVLQLPRVGPWHGDFLIDTSDTAATSVTIGLEDSGTTYHGTVIRQGTFGGYLRLRVLAGQGRLYSTTILAKAYRSVPVRVVVNDIMMQCGEQVDPTADQGVLGTTLQNWVCTAQGAIPALRSVLGELAPSWRQLPNGNVWFGTEKWPVVDAQLSYTLIREHDGLGRLELLEDAFALTPGVNFRGFNIGQVEYSVRGDHVATKAWFD